MSYKPVRRCDGYRLQFSLYLDGELDKSEQRALDKHLKDCRSCRAIFNRERWFLEGLQRTAPLYNAPDYLRSQIRSLVYEPARETMPVASAAPKSRLQSWFGDLSGMRKRYAAVATSLLVLLGLWVSLQIVNPAHSMTFAAVAVDAHQRHTLGRLPLELSTHSPREISVWFDGKVPFRLQLPNYQEVSGQNKLYRLKGARLIGFNNDYAAYVAYQMRQYPISLVVTSSTNAKPAGGDTITAKGLKFHYETIAGLKVITWTHRGLTYALVSDLEERGQQSCLVCHQGTKDKDLIGNLELIGWSFIDIK